ncbi:unnamed protein product [Vitrella brassicaformis CCMP3155]|uniref:Haloacid dehalogenase-like hydrolase n=1 Tax=Vitrella brassicaformis (strain CCMP3155) TaxID=1169540 RepID=A0A0G4GAM3_VITBC|nr:unnamed protein product [Vitrella brassicaformis CCMP3155]|eukprot:CEM26046.1 unnamed protein product [Vitrella brassicaformis CCMP3155]
MDGEQDQIPKPPVRHDPNIPPGSQRIPLYPAHRRTPWNSYNYDFCKGMRIPDLERKPPEERKMPIRYHPLTGEELPGPRFMAVPPEIFALDFDGVICTSHKESMLSAYAACKALWPERFRWDTMPFWLMERVRHARPVIETGYETLLVMRWLVEEMLAVEEQYGYSIDDKPMYFPWRVRMLESEWGPAFRDGLMDRYGASKEELMAAFSSARDEWIARNVTDWLAHNDFNYGMIDIIRYVTEIFEKKVHIVSTKQDKYIRLLLEHAGLNVSLAAGLIEIYGLGQGSKPDILYNLQQEQGIQGVPMHFVEDRLETLLQCAADPRLDLARLYFAKWGYSNADQKLLAIEHPRVRCVNTVEMIALMCFPADTPGRKWIWGYETPPRVPFGMELVGMSGGYGSWESNPDTMNEEVDRDVRWDPFRGIGSTMNEEWIGGT